MSIKQSPAGDKNGSNMNQDADLSVVIVGHVDHGKSTLIGRLLFETGSLPESRMRALREALEKKDASALAHVVDYLEEERTHGVTIDTSQVFFRTSKRHYIIIDAPGHIEFIQNMLTGSSQGDAALLLVDACEGIQDQTKRHCYLSSLIGLKQMSVIINKMDRVEYSERIFLERKAKAEDLLREAGIVPAHVVPVSAADGDNIKTLSSNMKWYAGPTVIECLDAFMKSDMRKKPLRFPVQDVYEVDGKTVYVGRMESGLLHKGQNASVLPEQVQVVIENILKFNELPPRAVYPGECVGITLADNVLLKRGQILVNDRSSTIARDVKGSIFWMDKAPGKTGDALTFKSTTQETRCVLQQIWQKFDPALNAFVQKDASQVCRAEVAEVSLMLESNVVLDAFADIPEMGRFILERDEVPVAGGVFQPHGFHLETLHGEK